MGESKLDPFHINLDLAAARAAVVTHVTKYAPKKMRILPLPGCAEPMVMLPRSFQLDTRINDIAKLLYAAFLRSAHGTCRTWVSVDSLAATLGLSVRCIKEHIKVLVELGLILRRRQHTSYAFTPMAGPEIEPEIDPDLLAELEGTAFGEALEYLADEYKVTGREWPGIEAFKVLCEPIAKRIYDEKLVHLINAWRDDGILPQPQVNMLNTLNTSRTFIVDVRLLYGLKSSDLNSAGSPRFARLPYAILCDRGLKAPAKLLYAAFDWYAGKNRQTWVSYSTLAKDLGWKRDKVKAYVAVLRKAELIRSESRGIKRSWLTVMTPLPKKYSSDELACRFH